MFSIDDALAHFASPLPHPLQEALDHLPVILGAPAHELTRSRAAAEVGVRALSAGLFLAHYEHRVRMPLPEHWCRGQDAVPQWVDGVLPEPKYAAFRHDLPVGTFHPGHRAKWTAHELCHRLVGTALAPDASPLFTATASRLAELLPVVLWYFLDEIGLARCALHTGPLFRAFCPDCDHAARAPFQPLSTIPGGTTRAEILLRDAARFVDAELAAIAKTKRLGRPVSHVWGSLDLCSDGLAYAAAHHLRLRSEAWRHHAERFVALRPATALSASLEQLEQRVVDTFAAIATGAPLQLSGDRAEWIRSDLAARLLEVWEQCEGDAANELLSEVDALAAGGAPSQVLERYRALHSEYDVPSPEELFGVGYDIDGIDPLVSRSVSQVKLGLETVTPLVLMLASDADIDLVSAFVPADAPDRSPVGVRFARWLQQVETPQVADLARYEAALRAASGDPVASVLGGSGSPGSPLRLASGAQTHAFRFDVVRFAEGVDAGEISGSSPGSSGALPQIVLTGAPDPAEGRGMGLVIARDIAGELVIAEIDPAHLVLVETDPDRLPEAVRDELLELSLLAPSRWEMM